MTFYGNNARREIYYVILRPKAILLKYKGEIINTNRCCIIRLYMYVTMAIFKSVFLVVRMWTRECFCCCSGQNTVIAVVMSTCQRTTNAGRDYCECPAWLMADYNLTLVNLASLMSANTPNGWTTAGSYCGSVNLRCVAPSCVTW